MNALGCCENSEPRRDILRYLQIVVPHPLVEHKFNFAPLPPAFSALAKLQHLVLVNCGVSSLPPGMHTLQISRLEIMSAANGAQPFVLPQRLPSSLRHLSLIAATDLEFLRGQVPQLRELYLHKTSLPPDALQPLSTLTRLFRLRLSACDGVPSALPALAACSSIRVLQLDRNATLHAFPQELSGVLERLEGLDLRYCGFEGFPGVLATMTRLGELDMSWCNFSHFTGYDAFDAGDEEVECQPLNELLTEKHQLFYLALRRDNYWPPADVQFLCMAQTQIEFAIATDGAKAGPFDYVAFESYLSLW